MKKEISIKELNGNFVKMISEDWALLTSGKNEDFNTMTVSWGGIGELWGKNVAFVFVRPQRLTYEYMEKYDNYTLSFFGGDYKKELTFCGRNSGRDADKIKETGLTPECFDGAVGFKESKIVVKMKKLAYQDIDKNGFVDSSVIKNYNGDDFHRVYIGEIEKVYAE